MSPIAQPRAYTETVSGCIRLHLGGAALEKTMSVTQLRARGASPEPSTPLPRVTAGTLLEKKLSGHPITALTAYDYPTARLVDEAGIDMSSSATPSPWSSSATKTPSRSPSTRCSTTPAPSLAPSAAPSLVADMPYGSYHGSIDEAVHNALRFIKEAGAEAVKIEGGSPRADLAAASAARAEVPVVGHIGLTPQSVHPMGGYRVQGKIARRRDRPPRRRRYALEAAGAVAIVLEGIPREPAARITTKPPSPPSASAPARLRRPDPRPPRPLQPHLRAARKVHPPVRRRRRPLHLRPRPDTATTSPAPLPLRRRELPPLPRSPVRPRHRPTPRPQSLKPRRKTRHRSKSRISVAL